MGLFFKSKELNNIEEELRWALLATDMAEALRSKWVLEYGSRLLDETKRLRVLCNYLGNQVDDDADQKEQAEVTKSELEYTVDKLEAELGRLKDNN